MDIVAVEALINEILTEVSVRMTDAYAEAGFLGSDHPLSQEGLANGTAIVLDYIAHNETKIAIEHLLYMVNEPPLALSASTKAALSRLCALYDLRF